MSYATWPDTLPRCLILNGLSFDEPDVTVRDENDVGPDTVRLRYTAASQPFSGTMYMTSSQLATFRSFFRTTLRRGTLPFYWIDPTDGSTGVFRFKPATFRGESQVGLWRISCTIEKLPI